MLSDLWQGRQREEGRPSQDPSEPGVVASHGIEAAFVFASYDHGMSVDDVYIHSPPALRCPGVR